jgi:predicted nucleic acid-binding protein
VTAYFLDTSALVKRYVLEPDHAWVRALCCSRLDRTVFVSQVALVEVVASLCGMAREHPPRLTKADRDRLIARFRRHVRSGYSVIPVTTSMYTRAANLCLTHPLRAYDAMQLACALTIRDRAIATGLAAPTFVGADATLLAVAATEGLPIENPNDHP